MREKRVNTAAEPRLKRAMPDRALRDIRLGRSREAVPLREKRVKRGKYERKEDRKTEKIL